MTHAILQFLIDNHYVKLIGNKQSGKYYVPYTRHLNMRIPLFELTTNDPNVIGILSVSVRFELTGFGMSFFESKLETMDDL